MTNDIMEVHPERILELILESLQDLINYELAVILKLNDKNQLVVEKALGVLVNDKIHTFKIDLHERPDLASILTNIKPHLFSDKIPHVDTYDKIIDLPDLHSCLAVPLYINESPIGLMTLDNSLCGVFSPAIVNFIGTTSRLIALIMAQNESSKILLRQQQMLTEERNFLLSGDNINFKRILGTSIPWKAVIELVRTVAASDLAVLIQGETGTGKEAVAATIHKLSTRKDKPFITLNCSALNASIAESELFGHEKGAFTSALNKRLGRFELADGGTLFLDEIADLPPEIQPKILRTLQEGTYERLGGEKTLKTDVRIIAATNKNLKKEVEAGNFREDLYYRLGVFPIELPPLRERDDDIVILAENFLANLRKNSRYKNHYLTGSALQKLMNYNWPGNVRELQNVIRRSALISPDGEIDTKHLSLDGNFIKRDELVTEISPVSQRNDKIRPLDEAIKEHINKALTSCEGRIYNENGAAALLGIKPTTLQSKMKKLGISRKR